MTESLFGADRIDTMVAVLHGAHWTQNGRTVRWPADHAKDRLLVQKLIHDYPNKDVLAELRKWSAWMGRQQLKGKVSPRGRIATWLGGRHGVARRSPATQHPRGARSVIGGAPATDWGPTGFRDW